MRHLIVSREYPPTPFPPGGIGTYVANLARLLVERGDSVHVVGQRWVGANSPREALMNGRLVVHRIGEHDLPDGVAAAERGRTRQVIDGLRASSYPERWFSFSVAHLVERLVEEECIDVIEAQEWEAPLYDYLLRRKLGLGPRRTPPCVIHLHSGVQVITRFNGPPTVPRPYRAMRRMEELCVREADALLCPSRYYAEQCAAIYGIARDRITTIPLPAGFVPALERSEEVWEHGTICYVGRLEPRKGIVEWIQAAATVALEDPCVVFDLVGNDKAGIWPTMSSRLPAKLRPRFRYHGSLSRQEVLGHLAKARAAVVPSRWENFPNVCIEAMSSGLPVIASRSGGMIEIIEDGRTGWLAPATGMAGLADGLAVALRRCLSASADDLATMGRRARETVLATCDNDAIVDAHRRFREALADRRSGGRGPQLGAETAEPLRAGIIVHLEGEPADGAGVIASISSQTVPPALVVITSPSPDTAPVPQMGPGTAVLVSPRAAGGAASWQAGVEAGDRARIDYWLFLGQDDALAPTHLERVGLILRQRPKLGVLSVWTVLDHHLEAPLCPQIREQLTGNDAARASAFRASALEATSFPAGADGEYAHWALCNAVLLGGWEGATVPEALASRNGVPAEVPWPESTALRAIRRNVLSPLAEMDETLDLVEEHVPLPSAAPWPDRQERLREKGRRYVSTLLSEPRWAAGAIGRRCRALLRRI